MCQLRLTLYKVMGWLVSLDLRKPYPPAPMNHVKMFKGWPPRDTPSELAQLWYKLFPPDQRGLAEMKNPTRLSNKTSNA